MMSQADIDLIEKINTGTAPTKNQQFDLDGYLVIRDFCDVSSMIESPPTQRGQITYARDGALIEHLSLEAQVPGSLSRYHYPKYRDVHHSAKEKIQSIIGCDLYETYFYDRFYFDGQALLTHLDRDSCEISLSLHISSGPTEIHWPFGIKSAQGHPSELLLAPGDAVLYKGCERPHWRNTMPRSWGDVWRKKSRWYHQIFFHYVLANGRRAHYAFDRM